jgi:hypothetical protein
MNLVRFLVLVTAMTLSSVSHAAVTDHDPHPLTQSEKEIFYPLVCTDSQPAEIGDGRMCKDVLGAPDNRNLAGNPGDPIEIQFYLITYGSLSKAGAEEAYITYTSSMEPEGEDMGGGILLRHENGNWKLIKLIHGGQMNECIALPGSGQQRMLCTFRHHYCCGASGGFTEVVTGIDFDRHDDRHSLLRAHDSRREFQEGTGDAGGYEFCKAGAAGRTLLVDLGRLRRSREPGMLAEAKVEYVLPKEIRRACSNGNHPRDAKAVVGQVRFRISGNRVKVLLPKGVKAFSTF